MGEERWKRLKSFAQSAEPGDGDEDVVRMSAFLMCEVPGASRYVCHPGRSRGLGRIAPHVTAIHPMTRSARAIFRSPQDDLRISTGTSSRGRSFPLGDLILWEIISAAHGCCSSSALIPGAQLEQNRSRCNSLHFSESLKLNPVCRVTFESPISVREAPCACQVTGAGARSLVHWSGRRPVFQRRGSSGGISSFVGVVYGGMEGGRGRVSDEGAGQAAGCSPCVATPSSTTERDRDNTLQCSWTFRRRA